MEGWIAMADVPEDVQRWTAKRRVALVLSRRSHAEPPEPRGGGARPGNRDLRGVRGRVFVNRDRAMSRIERVSYRSGFVKRLRESRHLPAITFEAADLPEDVVALLDAHLLDLGGPYGDPNAGEPIQHDELHIEHDQGDV